MTIITKENLSSFLEYYHGFHDSNITNLNYDINNSQIEISINVFWSGEPTLKEDGTYETNKTKIKIICNGVEQCNIKEVFSWDDISEAFINYIKYQNKEYICLATDEKEPSVYIVCENMEYEELK